MRRVSLAVGFCVVVLMLACSPANTLLEGAVTEARATATARPTPTSTPTRPAQAATVMALDDVAALAILDSALADVYERTSGSVVYISVQRRGVAGSTYGTGSGWIYDTDGHIVTNSHVVEGAKEVRVRFASQLDVPAEVVGADPDSDLAVIRVDVSSTALTPLQLGDSSQVRAGQAVVAIGNPFGFQQTLTSGVVSAVGRVSRQTSGFSTPNVIQTDAAINPGNSGGPLLDIYGRVIGVTSSIYSTTGEFAGIGFAIPVNTVKRIVPSLISTGSYVHPWLGLEGMDVNGLTADILGLPLDHGALVQSVTRGGPAAAAGVRGGSKRATIDGTVVDVLIDGDIIVAMDGRQVTGMGDLITYLEEYNVDDVVTLTVYREGEQLDLQVTLGVRPTSSSTTSG